MAGVYAADVHAHSGHNLHAVHESKDDTFLSCAEHMRAVVDVEIQTMER